MEFFTDGGDDTAFPGLDVFVETPENVIAWVEVEVLANVFVLEGRVRFAIPNAPGTPARATP